MGRKKKFIELIWNGKKVKVERKGLSWTVTPLEEQRLSQHDKMEIIKAVVKYG